MLLVLKFCWFLFLITVLLTLSFDVSIQDKYDNTYVREFSIIENSHLKCMYDEHNTALVIISIKYILRIKTYDSRWRFVLRSTICFLQWSSDAAHLSATKQLYFALFSAHRNQNDMIDCLFLITNIIDYIWRHILKKWDEYFFYRCKKIKFYIVRVIPTCS